jgi:hypothetical protein
MITAIRRVGDTYPGASSLRAKAARLRSVTTTITVTVTQTITFGDPGDPVLYNQYAIGDNCWAHFDYYIPYPGVITRSVDGGYDVPEELLGRQVVRLPLGGIPGNKDYLVNFNADGVAKFQYRYYTWYELDFCSIFGNGTTVPEAPPMIPLPPVYVPPETPYPTLPDPYGADYVDPLDGLNAWPSPAQAAVIESLDRISVLENAAAIGGTGGANEWTEPVEVDIGTLAVPSDKYLSSVTDFPTKYYGMSGATTAPYEYTYEALRLVIDTLREYNYLSIQAYAGIMNVLEQYGSSYTFILVWGRSQGSGVYFAPGQSQF